MSETRDTKLLQTLINGQKKILDILENHTKRLDMIGSAVAYLEDDTPTREEFENLETEVDSIKKKVFVS